MKSLRILVVEFWPGADVDEDEEAPGLIFKMI